MGKALSLLRARAMVDYICLELQPVSVSVGVMHLIDYEDVAFESHADSAGS